MIKRNGYYVADTARVMGDVTVGEGSSLWFGVVVRGDDAYIEIGRRVNVQDISLLHPQPGVPLVIGDDVSIGHGAVVHGKRVGAGTLIGMGAILLEGCEVGEGCIIGAGALIPERKVVPPGSVVRGVPGRISRLVTEEERAYAIRNAGEYRLLAEAYAAGRVGPLEK